MKCLKRFNFLLIPFHSIVIAGQILFDGIVDLCEKLYFCFRRGPIDELGEYIVSISEHFKHRHGKTIRFLSQYLGQHVDENSDVDDFDRPDAR